MITPVYQGKKKRLLTSLWSHINAARSEYAKTKSTHNNTANNVEQRLNNAKQHSMAEVLFLERLNLCRVSSTSGYVFVRLDGSPVPVMQ